MPSFRADAGPVPPPAAPVVAAGDVGKALVLAVLSVIILGAYATLGPAVWWMAALAANHRRGSRRPRGGGGRRRGGSAA